MPRIGEVKGGQTWTQVRPGRFQYEPTPQARAMPRAAPSVPGTTGGTTGGGSSSPFVTQGTPSATVQARALSQPAPVTGETPVNPMQRESYGAAKEYASGLASGTNEEIQRELGRARDEISVGMRAEGEGAMSRGADPGLFRSRALQAGQRNIHALQGRLADVALGRRAEAVGLQTGAAGAAAGEQRLMHLGTLSQRLQDQRALTEQAETQSRLYEAPYDRLTNMMKTVSGFTGGYDVSDVGLLGSGGSGYTGPGYNPNFAHRGRSSAGIPQFSSMLPML